MNQWTIIAPYDGRLHDVESLPQTARFEDDVLVPATAPMSDSWQKHFDTLDQMAGLKDDWDGDGAIAPSPDLVTSTRELLRDLQNRQVPAPSRVGAGPNGTILAEWQNGLNYFEIEVCGPVLLGMDADENGRKANSRHTTG